MAVSFLTIWLAEAARLFFGDAVGSFIALLGALFGAELQVRSSSSKPHFFDLDYCKKCLPVSLNYPRRGVQHSGMSVLR